MVAVVLKSYVEGNKMLNIHQKLRSVAKDITVLYVEDEQVTREQYDNILKLLFKEVKCASNGLVALEYYNEKEYDILITDLTMPQMDGVTLISEILKINPLQHTIIMTAHNTSENLRNSIDFQVDGILLKPVQMDKLFQLLYKVSHQIYFEKKDAVIHGEDGNIQNLLQNEKQALFLVVIDKFNDIVKQFGTQTKSHIFEAVKEHLEYFGIEDKSTIQLHNDVIICGVDKHYLDEVLSSLQNFSDSHNSIIVQFDDLQIYITLSYGVVLLEEHSDIINRSDYFLNHINDIIDEIKGDEHSTFIVKMDVDLEEAKKSSSLNWLGVTLDALKQKTIVPFYQPIVDIDTLEITSYEIFSRIKQGNKYILPKFFIDLSKKAGILEDISRSVFKQSFELLSQTNYAFHINLGDAELRDNATQDYLVYLSTLYDIHHSRVILDIINHESLNPTGKIVKSLLRLKSLGYKIALKGFASGSINIELISILQPDYIKINQELLKRSEVDINLGSMFSFLLEYTKKADIKSILVGVESENILQEGRKLGFDYVQGYLIKEPSDKL